MKAYSSKNIVLTAILVAVLFGIVGWSGADAMQPESVLASSGSADDHMAAAMLYQSKAQQLAAEADRYEVAASKIGHYEDTKGFRRGGLATVGEVKRGEARQMQELYAVHYEKAQAMYGMKKSE